MSYKFCWKLWLMRLRGKAVSIWVSTVRLPQGSKCSWSRWLRGKPGDCYWIHLGSDRRGNHLMREFCCFSPVWMPRASGDPGVWAGLEWVVRSSYPQAFLVLLCDLIEKTQEWVSGRFQGWQELCLGLHCMGVRGRINCWPTSVVQSLHGICSLTSQPWNAANGCSQKKSNGK